jgi:hypothetical protein
MYHQIIDIFTPYCTEPISTEPFPTISSWETACFSWAFVFLPDYTALHRIRPWHTLLQWREIWNFSTTLNGVTSQNRILHIEHGFRTLPRNISACLPDITASLPTIGSSTLNMVSVHFSETLVRVYQTSRRHIPDDSTLLLYADDRDSKFLREVCTFLPDYTASDSKSFNRKFSKRSFQQLSYCCMLIYCSHYLATVVVYRSII